MRNTDPETKAENEFVTAPSTGLSETFPSKLNQIDIETFLSTVVVVQRGRASRPNDPVARERGT